VIAPSSPARSTLLTMSNGHTRPYTGEPPPPLAGEDHVCLDCELSYAHVDLNAAGELIGQLPTHLRAVLETIPPHCLRQRPSAGVWSIAEYICHLRDVYITSTIRLYRARTEVEPVLEPMLNDLRALRFRYNDAQLEAGASRTRGGGKRLPRRDTPFRSHRLAAGGDPPPG
jgi:hypothetical protein